MDEDGASVQFTMLNSGKRDMRLDLKNEARQEMLRGLQDAIITSLS